MDDVLIYCYTGEVNLNKDNVGNILIAADYLLLDGLINDCCSYACQNIEVSNCIQLFVIAEAIGIIYLKIRSVWFIRIHFKTIISKSTDIGKLSLYSFEQILSDKYLNIDNEEPIWRAIVRWVEADEFNRFPFVPRLLTFLNIAEIDEPLSENILLNHIVSLNPFCRNLNVARAFEKVIPKPQIILQFAEKNGTQETRFNSRRLPSKIHFVVEWDFQTSNTISCYLTYNEELDVWREIGHLDFFPEIVLGIGEAIFLFDTIENIFVKFDLSSNEISTLWPNFVDRYYYNVITMHGKIYLLGGLTEAEIPSEIVERYDPLLNEWDTITSLHPMTVEGAVGLEGRIYAFGHNITPEGPIMVSQVYDLEFETWMTITSPNIPRTDFAVTKAEGKIFIIGGKNDDGQLSCVEVYDTFLDIWSTLPDMPYTYMLPSAIVLNEKIIVFENTNKRFTAINPPVYWNLKKYCWRTFKESSPWSRIEKFNFCTIENTEDVRSIIQRNRMQPTESSSWKFSSLA